LNTAADHINDTSEDEKELLARVAMGQQQAFTQLFDRYSPVIYPYLLYWLKQTQVVEEVMQDIFIRVWRNREKLREMDNFRGWLYVIARNKANTVLKQQLLGNELGGLYALDEIMAAPQHVLEAKELDVILGRAVDELPPRRREVFMLHRQEGLTYEEIGRQLGISRHTVKEHMVAALVFLKYYVKEHAGIIISWLAWVIAVGLL
jgi:RNA polymerase sigma-70 factor (ECF subfamily)